MVPWLHILLRWYTSYWYVYLSHPCVTELVYMCDMTRLQIKDVVLICILCTHLVKICTMTHPCVTELIHMCDMTRLQIRDVCMQTIPRTWIPLWKVRERTQEGSICSHTHESWSTWLYHTHESWITWPYYTCFDVWCLFFDVLQYHIWIRFWRARERIQCLCSHTHESWITLISYILSFHAYLMCFNITCGFGFEKLRDLNRECAQIDMSHESHVHTTYVLFFWAYLMYFNITCGFSSGELGSV